MLVDHERHHIVDVLPDDRSETVAQWLRAHPSVQTITRDRDEAFAKAITQGARTAVQMADRFHLRRNVRDVLERVFHRQPPSGPTPRAAVGTFYGFVDRLYADRPRRPPAPLGAQT